MKYLWCILLLLLSKGYSYVESFPDGTSLEYQVNAHGQIESILSSDGLIERHFTYDDKGRLISASSSDASFTRKFTEDSLIEEEIWDENLSLKKKYHRGLPASLTIANNHLVEFVYQSGKLESFLLNGKSFEYEGIKQLKSAYPIETVFEGDRIQSTSFNKKKTQYLYSKSSLVGENGRLYQLPISNSLHQPIQIGDTRCLYDVRGRLIAKQKGSSLTRYRYNALSELIEVENPHRLVTLTYDP